MRPSVLQYLACPSCSSNVSLVERERAEDGHVMSGALDCSGCKSSFPIIRGVPRLVIGTVDHAATETAARFGSQWKTFDHMSSYQEEWFRAWLDPLGPQDFRGKVVLEGGCGKGRHTVVAADWGVKDIVSVDLGEAVDVAFEHSRSKPNAHVIQADIMALPVKPVFDLAFSIGVLHHLPDPRNGFDSLRKKVKMGGKIAVWVYGAESNEWIVKYVNPVRENVTARMPAQLLYWLSLPPSAALAAALRLYKTPAAERLPYRDYLKRLATLPLREVHNIVYDQLVTPIAYYLPEGEVRSWFASKDFRNVTISWHNKNSWRASADVVASRNEHAVANEG